MKHLALVILTLTFGASYGSKTLRELHAEMDTVSSIKQKVHINSNISYVYARSNPDSGIVYGQQSLEMAIKHGYKYEEARANAAIGINYFVKSQYVSALEFQFKALKLYEDLDSTIQVAGTYSNISLIFKNQSDYTMALEYSLQALAIYDVIGETLNKAIVLENMGTLFFRQGDLEKAQDYYQKAYKVYKVEGDSISIARNRGNVGMVFSKNGDYIEAESAFKYALKINRNKKNQSAVQTNLANLGLLEYRRKDYTRALAYYDTAQVMAKNIGKELSYYTNQGNIGETYVKMASSKTNDLDKVTLEKGIVYLQEGINGCLALANADPAIGFYKGLSDAYSLKADYKGALEASKKAEFLKDSVHSVSKRISIENMEALHNLSSVSRDLKLKNQELQIKELELNESRQRVALYIMGLVIVLFLGMVSIYQLRKTKKRNKALSESNALYAGKLEEQLASLTKHATVLDEITYMQAHHVREPVAIILGMVEHFNLDNPHDPMNIFILENLTKVAEKLDVAVREVINKKDEVKEF